MHLKEALSHIHAPKGVSTVIAGLMANDLSACQQQDAVGATLTQAREKLAAAQEAMREAKSDYAYWGYQGDASYWGSVVSILKAADLVGADSLPDVQPPSLEGLVVMDQCAAVERFGQAILDKAKARWAVTTPGTFNFDFERGDAGMWFLTSPQIRGLMYPAKSIPEGLREVALIVKALAEAGDAGAQQVMATQKAGEEGQR